jgi:hypothetical protein
MAGKIIFEFPIREQIKRKTIYYYAGWIQCRLKTEEEVAKKVFCSQIKFTESGTERKK